MTRIGVDAIAAWAFLGSLGLRELLVVAVVAFILYGRTGVQAVRSARGMNPWMAVARRVLNPSRPGSAKATQPAPPPKRSKLGDRVFLILAITVATAGAAWVVTKMLIVASAGPSH
jgi:hypothetical protein